MIRKLFSLIFVLAMLALLVAPAVYVYQHPEILVAYTPESLSDTAVFRLPASTPPVNPTMLAVSTPTVGIASIENPSVSVTITADLVNLRIISTGAASGKTLSRGNVIFVEWRSDNYGEIIAPTQYAGYMVWRGCTSDAGNLGCEAK